MASMSPVQAPRVLPACDYCHTKKTRCDRQDPCSNCVTANLACLRRRPRQVTQNKSHERLDAVLERMARLEETIKLTSSANVEAQCIRTALTESSGIFSQPSASVPSSTPCSDRVEPSIECTPNSKRTSSAATSQNEVLFQGQQQVKRMRLEPSVAATAVSPASAAGDSEQEEEEQSPEDKILANLDLHRYLQVDRQTSGIDKERQHVLEAAIQVAKKLAMANPVLPQNDTRPNFYDPQMYPTAEFLHLMLCQMKQNEVLVYTLVHFAAISQNMLEDMTLALLHHAVHGQVRLQYLISVNQVAYSFLMASVSDASPALRSELKRSQQRYQDNILAASAHLDTTVRPDRHLFYALQSIAMLMQKTGRMRQCWRFNSIACRVVAALSEQPPSDNKALTADENRLLQTAYIRTFAFNSTLSANIYQPACPVYLPVDRSVLRTNRPADAVLDTLLSFAEVQDVIIQETRKCASNQMQRIGSLNTARVADLERQMRRIRLKIEEYRSESISATDDFLRFEWLTMDIVFHSLMVSITRLAAAIHDAQAHLACLDNARKCLFVLKNLLEIWDHCSQPDLYGGSLAWVIPLFPLRPIYFIFTNVVMTSDPSDLKLLQDVARGLLKQAEMSVPAAQIHRLCVSLLDLYKRYIDRTSSSNVATCSNSVEPPRLPPTHRRPVPAPASPQLDASGFDLFSHPTDDQLENLSAWDMSYFEHQIDWDLFSMQPMPSAFF